MLSSMTIWKLVMLGVLSALVGSAITITIIKVREPAPIECPAINEPSAVGTDTFKRVAPHNSARNKEY